jgi:hypothetical protein
VKSTDAAHRTAEKDRLGILSGTDLLRPARPPRKNNRCSRRDGNSEVRVDADFLACTRVGTLSYDRGVLRFAYEPA